MHAAEGLAGAQGAGALGHLVPHHGLLAPPMPAGHQGPPGVAGMGQHQHPLVQGEAQALLQEAEGVGGAQFQLGDAGPAPALRPGVEHDHRLLLALPPGQEARLDGALLHVQVDLQPPGPSGVGVPQAHLEPAPHPGEEVALLQGHHPQPLQGRAAHPPAHQEEAQHQGEDQVEQVVVAVHREGPQGQHRQQVLPSQAGDGQAQTAVVPEVHEGHCDRPG